MPTLFWTVFYLIVKLFSGTISWSQLLNNVCSIPFSRQGHGVLWFMYTLAGLYLLTPILARWLNHATRKEVRFYLFLWAISLLYPTLKFFVQIDESNKGILYYFTGYVGYFLLGWYLRNCGCQIRLKWLGLLYVLCNVAPLLIKIIHCNIDTSEIFWYLSIFVALQCLTWWKAITTLVSRFSLSERTIKILSTFSNLSFGIYLCHIYFMRNVLWTCTWIKNINCQPLQIITISVLTLLLSASLSYILSMSPLGNYTIGYCQKQR